MLKQSRKMQSTRHGCFDAGPGAAAAGSPAHRCDPGDDPGGVWLDERHHQEGRQDPRRRATPKKTFSPGECLATSESEHSKIAINLLRNTIERSRASRSALLLGILSDPRMRKFFQQNDRNGQHAEYAAGGVT